MTSRLFLTMRTTAAFCAGETRHQEHRAIGSESEAGLVHAGDHSLGQGRSVRPAVHVLQRQPGQVDERVLDPGARRPRIEQTYDER